MKLPYSSKKKKEMELECVQICTPLGYVDCILNLVNLGSRRTSSKTAACASFDVLCLLPRKKKIAKIKLSHKHNEQRIVNRNNQRNGYIFR